MNTQQEKTNYICFHIGRGRRFNSTNVLRFVGEEDFQQLLSRRSQDCTIISEDENGNQLPDQEWRIVDSGDNTILEGREAIEAMTGTLDFDSIFDTDYVTTADNLSEGEVLALRDAYITNEYMSDELKDILCSRMGWKRANNITAYPTHVLVTVQQGTVTIDTDQQAGEFTRDEWRSDLEDRGFCPISIDAILEKMEYCGTNDTEFFREG